MQICVFYIIQLNVFTILYIIQTSNHCNLLICKCTLNFVFHILDSNKRRHQLRKKIAVEKKAFEDAITRHNAVVGEAEKLPPPNDILAEDNYTAMGM